MSALAVVAGGQREAPEPFAAARAQIAQAERFLASGEARKIKHSDLEREIERRGREVMRSWVQAWLDLQGPGEASEPVRDAAGQERRHKRTQRRELETIFGTVTVDRTGYGAPGEASLHPLDGQLNLPEERYSLELRRRAAEEASKNAFDETVETLAHYTGARIAKRQVEELVQRAAIDFDAFYETRRQEGKGAPPAEPGSLMVITSDAKGVLMHAQDLRPQTRKAAVRKKSAQLRTRLSKGEKRGRKRMATVASVYTIARYVRTPEQMLRTLARQEPDAAEEDRPARPRPEHKRVWASLEKEPRDVLEEAFHDALDRDIDQQQLTWVCVVDGHEHQLDLVQSLARQYGVCFTIILDLFHVLGYLWDAGHAFHAEGTEALEAWVLERLGWILEGRAPYVAAGMRRSATKRGLSEPKRKPVDTCADYLLKYKHYLAYDQYLAAGMPIASGVIEGTCRHLINDRLALTGARWRLPGAEAILRLRALRASQDFDEYWRFHEAREHERNHLARYSHRQVPAIAEPSTPRLKLIK